MDNFEQKKGNNLNLLNPNFDFRSFFQERGFTNLQEAEARSSNKIYFGEKNGQELFLKKYIDREGNQDKAVKKAATEISCYENLPKENILRMVESDSQNAYLALERDDLRKIALDKQLVKEILDLYLHGLVEIDASFLPKKDWSQYEDLFKKISNLESQKIITEGDSIINKIKNQRPLIDGSKKVFSHNDYNLSNIKRADNRLIVFDFEHAARDNAMGDMATLYIDLYNNPELKEYFENNLEQSSLYNKDLFDLMVIRRCILVMNALANNQDSPYFKKNLEVFNEVYKKI